VLNKARTRRWIDSIKGVLTLLIGEVIVVLCVPRELSGAGSPARHKRLHVQRQKSHHNSSQNQKYDGERRNAETDTSSAN